jgi:HSP20 family molecular chaperone IbpA
MATMSGFYSLPYAPFYDATWVPETFPEHNHPLHNTRDRIAYAVHDFLAGTGEANNRPRADIRETATKYYIEVELAGAQSLENIVIKWEDQKRLFIRGLRKRTQLSEQKGDEQTQKDKSAQEAESKIEAKDRQVSENESKVHNLRMERHIGSFIRTFEFAVEVDQDTSRAYLHDGLLTIVVNKKHPENAPNKKFKDMQITKQPPVVSEA